jgi:hypothetical protein
MNRIVWLAVTAVLFLTGCAASPDPGTRPAPTDPPPAPSVAWMTEFCTIATDLRTALWASAADPDSGDPATLRQNFDAQLSAAAEALQTAMNRLDGLPPNPPPGAADAATDLDGRLNTLSDTVRTAQRSLAALPPAATEPDLGEVMGTVWPSVAARAGKPLDGVTVTADMKTAATNPTCRLLPGLR